MDENQFIFTLDNFNDPDGRKEDIELATALKNLKSDGWIEARYDFTDFERVPSRIYKLVLEDISEKSTQDILEMLSKYVEDDRTHMLNQKS